MEEILNNEQVRPGDETQLMHVVFSSDDEMMSFYLTLYRLMNPDSFLVQSTDKKRLEDLAKRFYKWIPAFDAVDNYKSISIKEVIKGFGMNMMNTNVSNSNRLRSAESVGDLMDCVLNTTKNIGQFKQMYRINILHLENIKYLLKKLRAKVGEEDGCEEEKNEVDDITDVSILS